MTTLPLLLEMNIQPLRGILVKSSSSGHTSTAALLSIDASPAITPRAPRLEASRSSRITVSVASGLRAWFCGPNQETVHRWFCGQTNKPRMLASASIRYLAPAHVHDFSPLVLHRTART